MTREGSPRNIGKVPELMRRVDDERAAVCLAQQSRRNALHFGGAKGRGLQG